MQRMLVPVAVEVLGEDEVMVTMSTSALARDGHILVPEGCVTDNYRRNNIWLWSHDTDIPTGNGEDIAIGEDGIRCRVKFAPFGISAEADKYNRLVKAGVVKAVSIGFDPIEAEPLDPKKPRGGQLITKWELLEASWVSVPADPGAGVTQRALGDNDMTDTAGDKPQTLQTRVTANVIRQGPVTFKRGLYQVAQLCYLFEELGWQVDMAKYEAVAEDDASQLPAMLGAVLADLGEALLAMTAEEIAEALAGRDLEPEEDDVDIVLMVEDRAHIRAATSPAVRALRRAFAHAKLRGGKTLSTETVRCLREAKASHEEGVALCRSALRKHKAGLDAVGDMMARAGVSDDDSDIAQTVQTSDGIDESEGSANGRADHDFRTRQATLLALAAGG